jgi:hypothetical protein
MQNFLNETNIAKRSQITDKSHKIMLLQHYARNKYENPLKNVQQTIDNARLSQHSVQHLAIKQSGTKKYEITYESKETKSEVLRSVL